jgi:hypothetical protein
MVVWGAGLLLWFDPASGCAANVKTNHERMTPPLTFGLKEEWRDVFVRYRANQRAIVDSAIETFLNHDAVRAFNKEHASIRRISGPLSTLGYTHMLTLEELYDSGDYDRLCPFTEVGNGSLCSCSIAVPGVSISGQQLQDISAPGHHHGWDTIHHGQVLTDHVECEELAVRFKVSSGSIKQELDQMLFECNERYDNLESLLVNEQDFRDDDEGVDERHIYHDEPKWVQNEANYEHLQCHVNITDRDANCQPDSRIVTSSHCYSSCVVGKFVASATSAETGGAYMHVRNCGYHSEYEARCLFFGTQAEFPEAILHLTNPMHVTMNGRASLWALGLSLLRVAGRAFAPLRWAPKLLNLGADGAAANPRSWASALGPTGATVEAAEHSAGIARLAEKYVLQEADARLPVTGLAYFVADAYDVIVQAANISAAYDYIQIDLDQGIYTLLVVPPEILLRALRAESGIAQYNLWFPEHSATRCSDVAGIIAAHKTAGFAEVWAFAVKPTNIMLVATMTEISANDRAGAADMAAQFGLSSVCDLHATKQIPGAVDPDEDGVCGLWSSLRASL